MQFGALTFAVVAKAWPLVAGPVRRAVKANRLAEIYLAAIDPELADTAAFCERYKIGLEVSANCVVVEAKRGDQTWYAACVILATDKVDVNGAVRKTLEARKVSFASMQTALRLTGMEYGGITPIGLPPSWPILVDSAVAATERVIVGSGLRTSKLLVPGALLTSLPQAQILPIAKSSQ